MPLLTIPGAIIGSAVLGAGASLLSGGSAASAERNAAAQSTAAQLQMFDRTQQNLAPYNTAGQGASNALMTALGLSPSGQPIQPSGPQPDWANYIKSHPDLQADEAKAAANLGLDPNDPTELANYGQWHYDTYGKAEGRQLPTTGGDQSTANPITGGVNLLTGYGTAPPTYTPYDQSKGGQSAPVYQNFNPTMADLENTPGYKFTLDQGLKSTQNSYASRGLASSGAAMKGAADYATGLASQTLGQNFNIYNQNYGNKVLGYTTGLSGYTTDYNNQLQGFGTGFNAYNTTQNNLYNRLFGLSGLGESAAAQTGGYGTTTAANIGNNITGAGNASAAASVAAGNNISGLAGSIPSAFLTNKLLGMYGPSASGGMYNLGGQMSGFPTNINPGQFGASTSSLF